jgi:hypothetical protein
MWFITTKNNHSYANQNCTLSEFRFLLSKRNLINLLHHLVQIEKHEDVPRVLSNDNELFIREDNDLIKPEQNTLQHSTNIQETSTVSEENKVHATTEEHDEDFERNFLRAVDRALGVVNKDENDLIQTNEDTISKKTDEHHLNLFQMTEQALSSLNNSSLFTVKRKDFYPMKFKCFFFLGWRTEEW